MTNKMDKVVVGNVEIKKYSKGYRCFQITLIYGPNLIEWFKFTHDELKSLQSAIGQILEKEKE
jgi:hypothetical protein